MLVNGGNTEGLFRAGIMQSGAPIPVGDITNGPGQKYYDALISQTGCSEAAETLEYLRTVPYATLKAAIDKSPGIFTCQVEFAQYFPFREALIAFLDCPSTLPGSFVRMANC